MPTIRRATALFCIKQTEPGQKFVSKRQLLSNTKKDVLFVILMLKSGFAGVRSRRLYSLGLCSLLTLCCWLAVVIPVTAYPLVTVPSVEMAMGKSLFSFSGKRPATLGIKDGKLAACPGTPNCVNSQAPVSDAEHTIAPLTYSSSPTEAMSKLKAVVESMERTAIVESSDNYLYAEFTTPLMGFVDDVEFYLDPTDSVIHVRSASRLGQSDLGLNRKRIEDIRARFANA